MNLQLIQDFSAAGAAPASALPQPRALPGPWRRERAGKGAHLPDIEPSDRATGINRRVRRR